MAVSKVQRACPRTFPERGECNEPGAHLSQQEILRQSYDGAPQLIASAAGRSPASKGTRTIALTSFCQSPKNSKPPVRGLSRNGSRRRGKASG